MASTGTDLEQRAAHVRAVVADVGAEAEALDLAGWFDALGRAASGGERLTRAGVQRLAAGRGAGLVGGPRAAPRGRRVAHLGLGAVALAGPRGAGGRARPPRRGAAAGPGRRGEGARRRLRSRAAARRWSVRRRPRLALLDGLLGAAAPDAVLAAAARLGVDLQGRRSVLVVGDVNEAVLHRLREEGALAAPRDGIVVAVLAGERAPRGPEPAGLGRPGLGVDGIRVSYGEARRALEVARRLDLKGVVPYEEVRAEALILSDRAALADLVETVLGPLEGGRQGAGPLVATLEAWLGEQHQRRGHGTCPGAARADRPLPAGPHRGAGRPRPRPRRRPLPRRARPARPPAAAQRRVGRLRSSRAGGRHLHRVAAGRLACGPCPTSSSTATPSARPTLRHEVPLAHRRRRSCTSRPTVARSS